MPSHPTIWPSGSRGRIAWAQGRAAIAGSTVLRAYIGADAPGVAACLTSAAAADPTLLPMTEEEWRTFVGRTFNHGGRDFMVAEADGRVVAVLISTQLEWGGKELRSFRVLVHPGCRRRGIARRMFEVVERQAQETGVALRAEVMGTWRNGRAMLDRRGFEVVERMLWMRAERTPEPVPPPEGVVVRAYRPGTTDDEHWTRINNEGYEGTSSFLDLVAAEREAMKQEPRFLLWMAERDGRPVGLCHTKEFGGKTYVNSLVVEKASRSRGLGRVLLAHGIERAQADHPGPVWLNVRSDNAHAVALYRALGFVVEDEIIELQRPPGPGPRLRGGPPVAPKTP